MPTRKVPRPFGGCALAALDALKDFEVLGNPGVFGALKVLHTLEADVSSVVDVMSIVGGLLVRIDELGE
jgi:hypothetical protein